MVGTKVYVFFWNCFSIMNYCTLLIVSWSFSRYFIVQVTEPRWHNIDKKTYEDSSTDIYNYMAKTVVNFKDGMVEILETAVKVT